MPAVVIREMCRGCGNCERRCPEQAIIALSGTALVDASRCTECETCLEVCMQGAITMSPRQSSTA